MGLELAEPVGMDAVVRNPPPATVRPAVSLQALVFAIPDVKFALSHRSTNSAFGRPSVSSMTTLSAPGRLVLYSSLYAREIAGAVAVPPPHEIVSISPVPLLVEST